MAQEKYDVEFSSEFSRKVNKLIKIRRVAAELMEKIIQTIRINPFDISLKTHKVNSDKYGSVWSSRIDGDLRLIWNFNKEKISIILITIGGHSGNKNVY